MFQVNSTENADHKWLVRQRRNLSICQVCKKNCHVKITRLKNKHENQKIQRMLQQALAKVIVTS